MTKLGRQQVRPIGIYGVVRPAEVDDSLIPDGAVTEVQNFNFDRKGAVTLRPGITTIGSTVTASDVYPCVGLYNAQQGTLIAAFTGGGSSRIYSFSSGAWGTSLSGGTSSVKIRFVDFGSYTITPNFSYNTLSSMLFWGAGADGSNYWKNTGSPINPQNMWGYNPQLLETYKSRIYAAGDTSITGNPSRLFFSSVISSTGNITWSPTTDYVDINPGDGEGFTGLKRFSLELLCFKPNYIYRFRTSGVDPDPLIKIGTRSQESIVEGKRGLYFHHDTGFYRYSGGYPEEISRAISDFVTAIPFGQFDDIAGWRDSDHIYWSVGNLTIAETLGNVTWKNVVLRYTESADLWTIYSYPNSIQRGSPFITGTSGSIAVGTDNGLVGEFNKGLLDFGEAIKYRFVTKWYEWEGIENRKTIFKLVTICEKARDANLMYQIDDSVQWETMGQLTKFLNYWDQKQIKFHRIRFKITGVSSGEAMVFQGIIITDGTNDGLIK